MSSIRTSIKMLITFMASISVASCTGSDLVHDQNSSADKILVVEKNALHHANPIETSMPNSAGKGEQDEVIKLDKSLSANNRIEINGENSSVKYVTHPAADDKNVITSTGISISFFKYDDYTTISTGSFKVFAGNDKVEGVIFFQDKTATFLPLRPLRYDTTYTVQVGSVGEGMKEGQVLRETYKWSFKTINPKADWIVFFNDLNTESPHVYGVNDVRTKWNYRYGDVAGIKDGRVSVVPGNEPNRGNVLKIRYEANKYGLGAGGVQWRTDLGQHEELYVSYSVRFENLFNFVRGGKIPGLVGGHTTSGRKPSGKDFFIGRMTFGDRGKAHQYVYHLNQRNRHGDGFPWNFRQKQRYFIPGQWHRLENRIRMNTPGKKNGIIQSWFDGELAFEKNDFEFRNDVKLKINQLFFSTFFGGGDIRWATTKEEYAYFDDVIVSKIPVTH